MSDSGDAEPITRVPEFQFGMSIAYGLFLVVSPLLIYLGSYLGIKSKKVETMSTKQALTVPIYASVFLFGLFMALYVYKLQILDILSYYFVLIATLQIAWAVDVFLKFVIPEISITLIDFTFPDNAIINWIFPKRVNVSFTNVLGLVIGSIVGYFYSVTHHWILNNIISIVIIIQALATVSIGSFQNGAGALAGLFFYDIFWVFKSIYGTSVMKEVAVKLAPIAPVLIKIPWNLDINHFLTSAVPQHDLKFAMLGLGDIVLPGLLLSLLLRFDAYMEAERRGVHITKITKVTSTVYFFTTLIAYTIGLGCALGALVIFRHSQPALLYLSPACIFTPMILAYFKGDFHYLWGYHEHENQEVIQPDEQKTTTQESVNETETKKNQ